VLLGNKVSCWVWSGAVGGLCTEQLPVEEGPQLPTEVPPPEDTTAPEIPDPLTPKKGESLACAGSVAATWSAVTDPSGIDSYKVQAERSPDNAAWSAAPGSPWSTGSTGQPIPVECGFYYRWRVRAVDGAGNASAFSVWTPFSVVLP
jgi:hypothetical protein